jgi:acyl-homoserine-lactone acylase
MTPRTRKRIVRAGIVLVALAAGLTAWNRIRKWTLPSPPRPDAATFEHAQRVTIVRDRFGVPHIFGRSDADAAFGLAYANAEDDWPIIQAVMAACTGRLGLLYASKKALANDYYVALVRVREQVDEQYPSLAADYREVLEGYARGLNLYAYLHPDEADGRLFPLSGRDIAAGFAHKVPLMLDLPEVIGALVDGPPRRVGERVLARRDDGRSFFPGSNAHAVAASRSTDGVTRLNVNSHQPWEGPVAWYEAQIVSEQGWNMTGGLFPGAPVILHGHNDHLGWAHTVNTPDLIDVYQLELAPGRDDAYLFEGGVRPLERKEAPLALDTGFFVLRVHKALWWSEHGPVIRNDHGVFAIRYAGMGRALRAGEQWYRMNKATDFAQWKAAMAMQAIPMFNTVYADDKANIFYVYNASLPIRRGDYDYRTILPGDRADALWTEYVPFADLPQVESPPSGFVQSCNSSPFVTTTGPGNPAAEAFPANAGIDTEVTNRAARSLALLGTGEPISREAFLRLKWDRAYGSESKLMRNVVRPLLALPASTPEEREALELLRGWDGIADEASAGATIALLTWRRFDPRGVTDRKDDAPMELAAAFRDAVRWLVAKHGKVNVAWGEVQRLRRGTVDLPIGGGSDVVNAARARQVDGHLVVYQGDSYVLLVELGAKGTTSVSIHQYGASNRPGSPHYADQAPRFVAHELKPTLRERADLARETERSYHPGE